DLEAEAREAVREAARVLVVEGQALHVVLERVDAPAGEEAGLPRAAPAAGAAGRPPGGMPPPSSLAARWSSRTRACVPHTSEPTGAPRPFERQNVTVSASSAHAEAGVPVATSALKRRAPSRWTESLFSRAACATSLASSSGKTRPPPGLCVFSSATTRVGA